MVEVARRKKYTALCVAIYVCYAIFVFCILPMLIPDPVTVQRAALGYRTRHLGDLSNYTMETGGTPLRSLLVTFKGSGAITLLDNLSHQPGCYHHFAPLLAYGHKIDNEPMISQALDELVALFHCNYNRSAEMLFWGRHALIFKRFYGQQWRVCMTYSQEQCWDKEMLSNLCKIYPFINMSVYNLRLKYLALLLEHMDLNIRIVLLVRDPRGTMDSRAGRAWCINDADCMDPQSMCQDMVNDYRMAEKLSKKFPQRFRIVRFEDLVLEPAQRTQEIFDFYGLPMEGTKSALVHQRHTQNECSDSEKGKNDIYEQPFEWLKKMQPKQVQEIQDVCQKAMQLWGYRQVDNVDNLTSSFDPLMQMEPFAS